MIQVPQGTSAQQIGQELETAGLIRSAKAWDLWTRWLRLKQPDGGFQAGNYELSTAEPLQAIAQKIWTGEVAQRSFTIPEGWSLRQMASYFEQQGFFKAKDFLTAASQLPTGKYPWLPTGYANLEGFLYPDTYQISAEAQVTPTEVMTQMLDRFEQVALPLYNQARDRTQFSLAQWVTLASIVEKEAVVASERPRIAGVFTNRLRQNIPLGSDPTVEYALNVQQTKEQPLTLAQVKVLKRDKSASREKGLKLLERVGLSAHANKFPGQLSGGQQQRVAIARAIVTDPTILVCDEPTGDLDKQSASDVLGLLKQLNQEMGKTIIMVTHDAHAAEAAKRMVHLEKGELIGEPDPVVT